MTFPLVIRGAMVLEDAATPFSETAKDIVVDAGRIVSIAPTGGPLPDGARIVDGANRLATPGLVNAHTHSQSSAMAGFADAVSHPAFMWLTQAHTAGRPAEEIRIATLLTALHMIRSGSTAAIDHFPGQRFTAGDIDAVAAAWIESGVRAVLGLRFFDGAFSDIMPSGAAIPDRLRAAVESNTLLRPQPLAELKELIPEAVARWDGREDRLRIFPAPSNPMRCTDEALLYCAEIAEARDLGIHTHLLETAKQTHGAQAQYGCTMVAHLDALGILSDRWSCAHSVWVDEADIARLAARGAIVVHNPESNSRLGSGIAPVPQMLKAGVTVALGTDGAGANDNMDMHSAMRAAAVLHRPMQPSPAEWITATDAMTMATTAGAAALRRPGLGRLAPGADADIVLHRLDSPWWAQINDPVAQLVLAETGASVDGVLVAGNVLMENGKVLAFDEAAVLAEARAMARTLRTRNADLFSLANIIAEGVN
ncbi:amidohydrolase family protein [Acuticoccus sp. M5D2P5]|uniref:amidohydrolase family protein n=1 Tax=Acuticoccus kalidii TaxID=2910977 RepID=UPI001F327B6C|nr:amidohydrolase family protein [Acuticoccus kalidii]MCF3932950.1 amidohydrolase family protein [Acuticoccus kalidii]